VLGREIFRQRRPAFLITEIGEWFLPIEETRRGDVHQLRILAIRHLVFAVVLHRDLDQLSRAAANAHTGKESGHLVELNLFPDLSPTIVVALGALNLNAEEEPGGLAGTKVIAIGAIETTQEENRTILLAVLTALALRRYHVADNLSPFTILLELFVQP